MKLSGIYLGKPGGIKVWPFQYLGFFVGKGRITSYYYIHFLTVIIMIPLKPRRHGPI